MADMQYGPRRPGHYGAYRGGARPKAALAAGKQPDTVWRLRWK